MPPPRAKVYGPMLLVADIERSVRFYRDDLGLKGNAAGPWAEFVSGGARLVLLERTFWSQAVGDPEPPGPTRDAQGMVLAVQVPDVDEIHRRLTSAGHRFVTAPTDVPQMGNRVAVLRDPDGNLVELTQMLTSQDMQRIAASRR